MAIQFDPSSGLRADDAATIRESIRQSWKAAFAGEGLPELNTDASTPAGQLIDSQAALVHAGETNLLYLANQFNPLTAEGKWQDALGKIYFLTRKVAESTVVECTCTGLYGTTIPAGAVVQNTDGYQLALLDEVMIPSSGLVKAEFAVTETGAVEIGAGTVTKIITTVAGWDTVFNEASGVPGRDEETRAEFEARRYSSVAANAHGSVAAIHGALGSVAGVLDYTVLENETNEPVSVYGVTVGAHSIAVCVYGGEAEDIAEVIYRKKDAGCGTSGNTRITHTAHDFRGAVYTYMIYRPAVTDVFITVTLSGSTSDAEAMAGAIKEAVYADFYGRLDNPRAGLGQTIYASRFYPAIISAGVTDLVGAEIKLGEGGAFADFITIPADVEPSLSLDNIQVVTANE